MSSVDLLLSVLLEMEVKSVPSPPVALLLLTVLGLLKGNAMDIANTLALLH